MSRGRHRRRGSRSIVHLYFYPTLDLWNTLLGVRMKLHKRQPDVRTREVSGAAHNNRRTGVCLETPRGSGLIMPARAPPVER